MARLHDIALPPAIRDELIRALDQIPPPVLQDAARELLPGGFTKPQAIRDRIRVMLEAEGPLPDWVEELFGLYLPICGAIGAFSPSSIRLLYGPMVVLAGSELVILGLLLDGREEMRRLGRERLEKPVPPPNGMTREDAADILLDFFEEALAPVIGDALDVSDEETVFEPKPALEEPVAAPPGPEQMPPPLKQLEEEFEQASQKYERLQQEREHLQQELEHARKILQDEKRRHKDDLREAREAAANQRKALDEELARRDGEIRRLAEEVQTLLNRLHQAQAEQQAEIARKVSEQTSHQIRPWLATSLETERVTQELKAASGPLLERAERVLQAQARQDRHTGNRLELEEHLRKLRQMRERLQHAAETSLHPLTELGRILEELEADIARAERVLNEAHPADAFAGRLLARVNQCGNPAELGEMDGLLHWLERFDLVSEEDRRKLYHAVLAKFGLLEERWLTVPDRGPVSPWSVRGVIHRNRPGLLLVDGHNVLFSLRETFAPDFDGDRPGPRARERLVRLIQRLVDGKDQVEVRVCFDGPHAAVDRVAPNIQVEFSGGEGPHRADYMIERYVLKPEPGKPKRNTYVVSDDGAVRRAALQFDAVPVSVSLFGYLLTEPGPNG